MRQKRKKRYAIGFVLLLLAASSMLIFLAVLAGGDELSLWSKKPVSETAMSSPSTAPATATSENDTPDATMLKTAEPIEPTPSPEPQYAEAVWIAAGDVMMHKPQLPGSYNAKKKSYNFDSYFTEVSPLLKSGDWVMANLETPVAGSAFGYTGYPSFNAPTELLDALQKAGFNILTNANNHSLDKGEKGARLTLKHLKQYPFVIKGTAESQEEADQHVIVEHNGIKMGLLAYTYGTNGIPLPDGKPYLVNLIDENRMIEDIHTTKAAGADFVTIALHFGTEYETKPNAAQLQLARKLIAEGADIIAGSHPHVLQPYEVLETTDSEGFTRRGLIIYSLGNFISNQRGDTKDYGAIFKVLIRKNLTTGKIELGEIESIPTWVHRYKTDGSYKYRILPVEQTLASKDDTLLTKADYDSLNDNLQLLRGRLNAMLTDHSNP